MLKFSKDFFFKAINSLPNSRSFAWSRLKGFADNISNMAQMIVLKFERVENIVGKGENAGYWHFLLFPQCFQKLLPQGYQKSGLTGKGFKVRIVW